MKNTQPRDVDARIRTLNATWVAMIVSVGVSACAAWALVRQTAPHGESAVERAWSSLTHLPFGVPLAAAFVLALAVGLTLVRRAEQHVVPLPPTRRVIARYVTLRLIGLAVLEGGGLLVIVASTMAAHGEWALGAGATTIGAMWMAEPNRKHIERLLRP